MCKENITDNELLNIKNVRDILRSELPNYSESIDEGYGNIINDLIDQGITNTNQLKEFIVNYYDRMLSIDNEKVDSVKDGTYKAPYDKERIEKGGFFVFEGLVKTGLMERIRDERKGAIKKIK